jgi:SAM-dependent methyltransferase
LYPTESPLETTCVTFRDPQGRLFREGERIFREIYPEHIDSVLAWIGSPLAKRWIEQGRLIPTEAPIRTLGGALVLEHDRIFFPSYPWEWTLGQWRHAALLTLDLCEEALSSGYILKDATPLNVLFSGPRPIFVDVLSFERRDPQDPIWVAYAQFVRTFVLPLAAHALLGWPLAATQHRRDGYEPADLVPWLPFFRRWRQPIRSLVTIPLLLQKFVYEKSEKARRFKPTVSSETASQILRRTVGNARNWLDALPHPAYESRWSNYPERAEHYAGEDRAAKREFISGFFERTRPKRVLDIGANTGVYSRIAAEAGADVIAWDTDMQASDANWQMASDRKLSILPLVADFARPTPAVGWRNVENQSLMARAEQQFDCVLALGVLHHLLITDRIPLPAVLDQLASITSEWAVLEWVPKSDSQFESICRGREGLYAHLTEDSFSEEVSKRFVVHKHQRLSNGRTLWILGKV